MIEGVVYLWIKVAHVAAVVAFTAGALAQALFIIATTGDASAGAIRRFVVAERWVSIPALLIALATGVTLATAGGWFSFPWLRIKLVLVVGLLGLHGYQSAFLRRRAAGQNVTTRPMLYVLLGTVVAIAALAVTKLSFQ